MKFCAPGDEPISVNLTSGHTFVVHPDGTETPAMFHREAIARGCTLAGAIPELPAAPSFNRALVIGEAMEAMVLAASKEDFGASGKPDLRRLSARAGFQVSREEADAIWAEVAKDTPAK